MSEIATPIPARSSVSIPHAMIFLNTTSATTNTNAITIGAIKWDRVKAWPLVLAAAP